MIVTPARLLDDDVHVYRAAVATWGKHRQLVALLEELGELSAAVSRYLNKKGPIEDVVEEGVDVGNLLGSLREIVGDDAWRAKKVEKVAKLRAALARGSMR